MNKRILVPLDGSPLAEMALPHAVAMARATASQITLLRTVPAANLLAPLNGALQVGPPIWQDIELDEAPSRQYLADIEQRLHVEEGIDARSVLLEGEPSAVIVRYVEQHPDVNLIVMSTHGRSGVSRWFFGSVAERVLHSSPVPLLLIHPKHHEGPAPASPAPSYREILIPLDGSPFAEQAIEQAVKLAAACSANLRLITVVPLTEDYYRIWTPGCDTWLAGSPESAHAEEYLDGAAQRTAAKLRERRSQGSPVQLVETQICVGDPAEEILKVSAGLANDGNQPSESRSIDIIVMSTHGRSGIERLWLGSVALKVVRGTTLPVLLVRVKERVEEPGAVRVATVAP